VEGLLDAAEVPARRRPRAREVILRQRLGGARLDAGWRLRLSPGAPFGQQARRAGLPGYLALLVGVHLAQYLLWLLSWWVIGRGALQGQLEPGWLIVWAALLLGLAPGRMLAAWAQGRLALGLGGLLKRRLLFGALRLEPEEVRHAGAGRFLGQVIESESLETLALEGGFLGLLAAVELALAGAVLAAGPGGAPHALLLLAWTALVAWLAWRYARSRRRWTRTRLDMTYDLVERLVGHRTRLAQEAPEAWHAGEEGALAGYLGVSRAMDRDAARLMALAPRGWLAAGLAGLAPAFLAGDGSASALAAGLGGVLLAFQAFRRLEAGLRQLAGAAAAWEQVAPLFHAAARPGPEGRPEAALVPDAGADGREPLVEARRVVFRYRSDGQPVLRGLNLALDAGERVLLEGESGSGKSTLAALLTVLRRPEAGRLALHGRDRAAWGETGWRRRVVAAPQFHENHVLTGSLAFNLLMGRRWPPEAGDLDEAEALCRELGLGDLLARMPAGLLQTVGETGWQLSHGERGRLYAARALLQGAELVIFDESFAALDPDSLRQALECALRRAPTLLLIAHS
jgi:ATP-binding cassette subfamily B protein